MKTSYRERDYAFGEKMLHLRTEIGLTQAGLANKLGVSRRAVGEWEAGNSYPKAQYLKELIALGVKSRAFHAKHEVEEIRALWKAARQKVLLDERWLSSLLEHSCSPHVYLVPKAVEESMESQLVDEQGCRDSARFLSEDEPRQVPTVSGPRVHWGDALAIPTFYGREQEMAQLTQWIVQDRCRVVSVLGMGGIGKSALSVSTMYQLAVGTRRDADDRKGSSLRPLSACPCPFEVIIFHSLRDAPAFETLLNDCLQVLSPQSLGTVSANLEQRLSLLLSYLRTQRVLLVLDNLECLLQEGDVKGRFRPGFGGYGQLLRRVAETAHQSCLLLTSREKLADLRPLEGKSSPVRSLRLSGLDIAACKQLFAEKVVVGTEADQERLIDLYGGNPLALKVVAETVIDLFGGEIGAFLAEEALLFGGITDLLEEHFVRLSAPEHSVLCWLAIAREPVTLDELQALLVSPLPRSQVLEAVDSLCRRSLIESGKRAGIFTLQSVVLEYMTAFLIAEGSSEIKLRRLDRLIEHGLSQAKAPEYVRQAQERLLLSPLLANLQIPPRLRQAPPPRRADGAGQEPPPTLPVEEQLLSLLEGLRGLTDSAQGYGPANLMALLRLLRGHLRDLDLSRLSIRGAYLQGIQMHDASLCGALMRDTIFAEAINATWAVVISLDGKWWAAGSRQGKVRLWDEKSQTLHLAWQAHTDVVYTLAFSPDGRLLASGSLDDTVKLWEVESGTLLWMGRQNSFQSLAFSPDGSLLASCGLDTTVRLWETGSHGACPRGTNLQTLTHPGDVFAVAFSPDGCRLASGCADGQLRLWERQRTEPTTYVETLSVQTDGVASLTFSPDGKTLASTSTKYQTVKLWGVGNLRLLHTLSGHTDQSRCVAWSRDSRTVAYSSSDNAICVFDVERGCSQVALVGHTADVYGLAFTPDGKSLLSGSADGTQRVWDVQSGRCVRVIAGYAVSLCSLDWSPDGTQLVSGGSDELVTIWDLREGTPPRELRGHHWAVGGRVGWSPDGRFLASCGAYGGMCLWNPTSGVCVQMFDDPSVILSCIAWSPNGSLLAGGTYQRGMQVWDIAAHRLHWVGLPYGIWFLHVAWSPDGTRLVGAANDDSMYLWEGTDGTLLKKMQGEGKVMSLAWSPDGTWLASGGSEGLSVWDVHSGECVRTFERHPCVVYALVWSRCGDGACPRGDWLVSGGSDGILRWWDVLIGKCVNMRAAHQGTIHALRISPDGRRLASCGDDGAIMIWDLCSGEFAPPLLRTLRHDRPYERLNITGIRGLTEAEIASLRALGAIECDSFDPKP